MTFPRLSRAPRGTVRVDWLRIERMARNRLRNQGRALRRNAAFHDWQPLAEPLGAASGVALRLDPFYRPLRDWRATPVPGEPWIVLVESCVWPAPRRP